MNFGEFNWEEASEYFSIQGGSPLDESLKSYLGYGGRFLTNDPSDSLYFEVAEVLREAASGEWDIEKLEENLGGTKWWNQTEPLLRDLQQLESSDPMKALQLVDPWNLKIREQAEALEIELSEKEIADMSRDAYVEQWTDKTLISSVLMQSTWEEGEAKGTVEDKYLTIDSLADNFMVSHLITEGARDSYAKRLVEGTETMESLTAEFSRMAASAYTPISDRLNEGYTTQEIMGPYRVEIAKRLELVDPNSIDFVDDEKFQPFLYGTGGMGENMMTIGSVGEYVRTNPNLRPMWEKTNKARKDARTFADFVTQKFGGIG